MGLMFCSHELSLIVRFAIMFDIMKFCFCALQKMTNQCHQLFHVLELHATKDHASQSSKFRVHSSEEMHDDASWVS